MQNHVGDWFEGVIASVTHFGFFVRLTEFHIDGLVHITHLDNDYYHFDDVKQALLGETFGKVYRLGDSITVQVLAVHLDERKIDFAPEIMATGNKKSKRKKTSKIAKTGEKKGKPQLKQTKPSKKRGKA
jgi:ribonuclease R